MDYWRFLIVFGLVAACSSDPDNSAGSASTDDSSPSSDDSGTTAQGTSATTSTSSGSGTAGATSDTGPASTSDQSGTTVATSGTGPTGTTGPDPFELAECTQAPDCGEFFQGECDDINGNCDTYEPQTVCVLEALRDAAAFSAEGFCCGLGPSGQITVRADGLGDVLTQGHGSGDVDPTPWFGEIERCTPKPPDYFTDCLANVQQECRVAMNWWQSCEPLPLDACP